MISVCFSGSVSPPGGDFSDPVTSATLGIVQVRTCSFCHSYKVTQVQFDHHTCRFFFLPLGLLGSG